MANKALFWAAAVLAGYAACRGIMETQETREITPKSAYVLEIEGIFLNEIKYIWREGENAFVSYSECDASEYGKLAVVPMRRCKEVSIGASGICSDAITGICVGSKCMARDEMAPGQIYAAFRKYEELCDILDCDSICEEWKEKAGLRH